jgi:riboflavin kinase/FMN adenylyltransferase
LNLSARDFFETLVRDNLGCKGVVEGENFCFGKDRQGDVDLLKRLCRENDIKFQVAEMESTGGEMISSTRIRDALLAGEVAAASQMMGTPHKVVGRVVPGDARGRTIGFPTANLAQIQVVIPAPGVYAAIGRIGMQTFPAAVHIGESPTFGSGDANKVEVHLIGFDGDLYDQQIAVEFVQKIRGIVRFDSPDELTSQLRKDIRSSTELLREFTSEPK